MMHNWTAIWVIASAVVVSAVGVLVWKKKKRSFISVGKIRRLFFYPVKSLKGIEVEDGICTSLGFVVNGLLDRSFMLVDGNGKLVSQREAPTLVLLTPQIIGKYISILAPTGEEIRIEIKDAVDEKDKIVHCLVHTDSIDAVDCGDEAALYFQSYLKLPDVRLVRQFSSLPDRKYLQNHPFFQKIKKQHPIGFQDVGAFHLLSQASIDNLNLQLEEKKVSVFNFRPNILVDNCKTHEEDSWNYLRLRGGAELCQLILTTRCIMTTNDPSTGIITKKDPLVTMRKFRIPKHPDLLKKTSSIPCMGVSLAVLKSGPICVGEDIFADVGDMPEMAKK